MVVYFLSLLFVSSSSSFLGKKKNKTESVWGLVLTLLGVWISGCLRRDFQKNISNFHSEFLAGFRIAVCYENSGLGFILMSSWKLIFAFSSIFLVFFFCNS